MSKTHLQTAHEYGVKQALLKAGYASIDDVQRDVATLGLIEPEKTAADTTVDNVFAKLKAKLG
jgi:hypothetical protein